MKVYNVQEVAELLGVGERTIYTFIKDKELIASKIGRNWIVQEEDIKRLLDSKRSNVVED